MRRLWALSLIGVALAFSSCTCVKNPYEAGAGVNNGAVSHGLVEIASPNTFFAPTNVTQTTTIFGGPITYSWGGVSTVATKLSEPTPAAASTCPPPCFNIWMPNGDGIGGPTGNFGPQDYYIRYAGHKGGDPSLDFSSMTTYLVGNQIPTGLLAQRGYQGFIFFARGHGNFEVSLAGNNTGDPYSGYNFYTAQFGNELTGDSSWHQITVHFSDMVQLYGQAADIHNVLTKCYGLQFDQAPPVVADFQLDVDYIRFF